MALRPSSMSHAQWRSSHLVENAIAQNSRVIHHRIDPPEIVQGRLHDALGAAPFRHTVGADHSLPTRCQDLGHNLIGRAFGTRLATDAHAGVVDHYLGSVFSHQQCDGTPDASARTRHHHHLVFHQLCVHVASSREVQSKQNDGHAGLACQDGGVNWAILQKRCDDFWVGARTGPPLKRTRTAVSWPCCEFSWLAGTVCAD